MSGAALAALVLQFIIKLLEHLPRKEQDAFRRAMREAFVADKLSELDSYARRPK